MKLLRYLITALLFSVSNYAFAQSTATPVFDGIQQAFEHIPDSVQTSVYWYWLSGNISKEGVVKDLEAMKQVGINRAFIGNIGLDAVPYGKVKMFSEEWWDILATALKTATRLHIDIGMFNGPGWSQSGGPWIKPAQSMRYLTSSQVMVQGPLDLHKKLPTPQADFQDVKLLAYPVPAGYNNSINTVKPVVSSEPALDSLRNLLDGDMHSAVHLKAGKPLTVNISATSAYTIRSVVVHITQQPVVLEGDIQAWVDNSFATIKHFRIDRSNPATNTGFIPYGAAAISVPATTAKKIRIVFTGISSDGGITELQLSPATVVDEYMEKTLAKMWPNPHPFWDAYQWKTQPQDSSAYDIDPAKVLDISSHMQPDGTLQWKVPAGNWIIERTGMAPTYVSNASAPTEGFGLEADKMSSYHIADHFNAFLGAVIQRIPAEDRKCLKVTVADSYETGGQNWTDSLIPEFKQTFHYDPTPYIPVLSGKVVGNATLSDRFLWDLRRLIANDLSFKYVGGLSDISHKYGLTTWLENYGHWGFPGEFLQYGGAADEVGGEFWNEGDLGDIENRAAASSAHIYGKTKVSAESFTAALNSFGRYPANLKQRADRFFTEGVNNTLLHVYIQQPQDTIGPGLTAWFSTEFNRMNTWFYDMDIMLQYIKRCNFMLQQGVYAADVAYFIGEDAPKMTGVTDPPLPPGYSYDYINADVIKQRLTVKDGKLVLPNGITYNILVLPLLTTMRPELLTKIQQLVQEGAVVMGPKPLTAPGLENYPIADKQVKVMADALWGRIGGSTTQVHHYGKGMVLSGMNMTEALDLVKLRPDLQFTGSDSLLFIHRNIPGGAVYFISSQKKTTAKFSATFRITGKSPELWNALDGSMRDLPVYTQNDTATTVDLQLAPSESVFIVFRKDAGQGSVTGSNYPVATNTITIIQPWTVQFDSLMRGPVQPVIFNTLTDWSAHINDSIRYYSGTAMYHNSFTIDTLQKESRYIIDLGNARAIAKVSVNGKAVGGVWTAPYQVDITAAVKQGVNQLDIKVVNTWVNRLVGDAKLPAAQRKTTVLFGPGADTPLQASGLLGPVVVREVR